MIAGLCLRFFQGLGDVMVSTAGYSIVTIEFPGEKEQYIGYCQASVGIGLMLGPVFGVALYSYADFELTFYIFAAVLSLGMVFVVFAIPNHLNHADDIMSKTEIDQYFERLRSTSDGR
jgi:MFS family permease